LEATNTRVTTLRTGNRARSTHRSESFAQERTLRFGIQAVTPTLNTNLLRATTHAKTNEHEGEYQNKMYRSNLHLQRTTDR
jgi:hypothetical protein